MVEADLISSLPLSFLLRNMLRMDVKEVIAGGAERYADLSPSSAHMFPIFFLNLEGQG